MQKKVTTLLLVYYAYMLEYRAELLLWALSGTLPLILMGVWMEASRSGNFGLSPEDFARYFLTVFMVRQFNVVWVVWEFEREVVEGKLSPRLLQPMDPGWHHFASHVSERLARLPFVVILVGFFFLLYPNTWWVPSLGNVFWFAIVIILSFCLRFLMQYTFALLAFWTERASAIEQFVFLFYLFLSGMIAPLEIFPPAIRTFAEWTPFPYMIHFPAAIIIGLPVNIPQGILVILSWLIIFWFMNRWLWRRGLRHYSGMGA